jgi:uncharacterized membrane protein (UPF0136 family)
MTEPHLPPQNRHPSKSMAGGFFIFASLIAGAIIGLIYDEPSMGMVGGFAVGVAIAVAIWLMDRRKDQA